MSKDPNIEGGHNAQMVAADVLRGYVERIERLEEEKAGIASDIRDVYTEVKAKGFETKVVREIIKLRRMDPDEREEREALRALYGDALGIFG